MEPTLFRATGRSPAGRLFVALWGSLALVDVSRPSGSRVVAGALVLVLVACCGAGQPASAAAAVATTGWLVLDGFVQHDFGQLGFSPTSWLLLAVMVAATLAVSSRTAAGGR
jgi:hypothetical protein